MPTSFLPYQPEQEFLLPLSLRQWLPEDHLAYFVSEVIDQLGLSAFYARYEGDGQHTGGGCLSAARGERGQLLFVEDE